MSTEPRQCFYIPYGQRDENGYIPRAGNHHGQLGGDRAMARGSKPSVETRCVANNYTGPNERIVEVSSSGGGCLIEFRTSQDGERLEIYVYQADRTVTVKGPFYAETAGPVG